MRFFFKYLQIDIADWLPIADLRPRRFLIRVVENIGQLKRMTRPKATRVHKSKSQMSDCVEKIVYVGAT